MRSSHFVLATLAFSAATSLLVAVGAWAQSTTDGTITGDVAGLSAGQIGDTVVYIKKTATPYTGRQLTLGSGPGNMVAAVGDTLLLGAEELRPAVPSTEPLALTERDGRRLVTLAREGIYLRLGGARQKAYVFIGQNPFAAAVDESGHYVITNVPPGDYDLAVWNPWTKVVSDQRVRVQPGVVSVNFVLRR